jgi:Protein of unknown function (DUF2723)
VASFAFTELYQEAMITLPESTWDLERNDYWVAFLFAALFLTAYVRTLAPDVLYSDSAEFQTLAYTFGITHSTGYPTYLLLARLLGFLPLRTPAWRISLFSAVSAAMVVGGIYLLARDFTRSKIGAALGAVALGISYTFWSQAVIAEVYTPGMALWVAILLLLFHWQTEPGKHNSSLLFAALLAGIGFGVHASIWLLAPPAMAFVVWTLWWQGASRSEWVRAFSAGFMGALTGLGIFLTTFLISDQLNPPTSFIRTTLEPSRVFWNLQPKDFDSPFKRLKMTVISVQWGDSLFPEDDDFSLKEEWKDFKDRLTKLEFPRLVLLFAGLGAFVMVITRPLRGVFYLMAFFLSLFFALNYRVDDKYVFYLSLYIPLTVAVGAGIGFVLEQIHHFIGPVSDRYSQILYVLPILFFVTMVMQPTAGARWQAIREGAATFVTEDFAFPVKDLKEPRQVAEMQVADAEQNAVFVLEWRGLYATAYLAHVEKGMTNTLFFEAMPAGHDEKIASTLIAELKDCLQEGRPVYVEQRFPGLETDFFLLPTSAHLYKLSLRE